jgi:isopenicillin-N epimerase
VRAKWRSQFPIDPGLVMFNHASFGLPTRGLLDHAETIRRDLERDPNINLGETLQARLDDVLGEVCSTLGLQPATTALTPNATAGAAAIQQSLPLQAGDVVVTLDCEYSSMLRGWRRRCQEVGAHLLVVPVPLPLASADDLLQALDAAAPERVAVLHVSAISSSAALALPTSRLAAWGHARGAVVVVDAAHAPGHVDVADGHDADLSFGTLHKWYPVPRAVGILRTRPRLEGLVRPAEVSLTWDSELLAHRFGWPGTFDPAARLAVPEALRTHHAWAAEGELSHAERVAEHATVELAAAGAVPTAGAGLRPPRLRGFILPGVDASVLRQHLLDAGVRAWTGGHGADSCLLRLATHVYNDEADVHTVRRVVEPLLNSARAGR